MKSWQPVFAEFLGTALLLAVIVGSGIMGERLAGGNAAVALLANSFATGAGLVALIAAFAPVSGAHFNPLVSVLMACRGDMPWREIPAYTLAQLLGALAGVIAAHGMFGLPLLEVATKARPGMSLVWSEVVATVGLLLVIHRVSKARPEAVPYAVGCYIAAAYWFTSSTSFANPVVTVARAFTNTVTGISPNDVAGFIIGEGIAAVVVALCIGRSLLPLRP